MPDTDSDIDLLVLVRHGQSVRNVVEERVGNGISGCYLRTEEDRQEGGDFDDKDIPLTNLGKKQAKKTGKALWGEFRKFDLIIHSGYLRTVQTTEGIIAGYPKEKRRDMEVEANLLVRERDLGYCRNMIFKEVSENFPWLKNYWSSTSPFFRVPFGGESIAEMCSGRLPLFMNYLNKQFRSIKQFRRINGGKEGGKILVVSHGRSILGLRYLMEGWSYEEMEEQLKNNPPNCGVTCYWKDQESGKWEPSFENRVYYD